MDEFAARLRTIATRLLCMLACLAPCNSALGWQTNQANVDEISSDLDQAFKADVHPFLTAYCIDCHGAEEPEAALDLSTFDSAASVVQHFATWNLIRDRVAVHEMPPQESGVEVDLTKRSKFLQWLQDVRDDYIRRHAGDPGEILARRLSAAEYDNTIRDLTGVDIRPAAEFPIDPSNEAGFDNSGESLVMTPSLLNKYLSAARKVADHLLFLPDGLAFAPHPVVTETDRDKYCVRRIVDFYQRQNTNLADYFYAAWQLRELDDDIGPQIAQDLEPYTDRARPLSEKYLGVLWDFLRSDDDHLGPIREMREAFRQIPAESQAAKTACAQLAKRAKQLRDTLVFDFPHLSVSGINRGSQPLVLWRNRQKASHRMQLNEEVLADVVDQTPDKELLQTEEGRTRLLAAYQRFCRVIPDRFYVDRRGREYLDQNANRDSRESNYRLLSAGFHSMMGYFRDDQPLCELLLTHAERERLDKLWFQLEFVANVPERQHSGFIWFERAEGRFLVDPEFDDFRSADKNAAAPSMVLRLRDAYLAKAERLGADEIELQAMRDHFQHMNARLRAVDQAREAARDAHLAMLPVLAERAYRRPLSAKERVDTIAFYHQLVEQDGLTHRDAIRDVFVSILMSPYFCYRTTVGSTADRQFEASAGDQRAVASDARAVPLGEYELASRLSYYLWSSMPDEELLGLARSAKLTDPDVLARQVSRMLRDPKSRGLALEFAGNWLGFRQFGSHNSVDRNRFPQFDDELRTAMFEEPVRFTLDIIQNDRSILDFLYGTHTFVNENLAKHYRIAAELPFDQHGWTKVTSANEFGRGGILPMAVFLTQNSPGLRTSPVKRGYWVVRQLLGTHIPAPPPDVPELPEDESQLGELTLRQVLAKHREHESCSGCHEKFDSVGLVFENFGPVGELRQRDLGGNPVELDAIFPDGSRRNGVDGLREYIRDQRQQEFIETLCRKLLSYSLGRSLIISDEPLLQRMQQNLRDDQYSFHQLVKTVVLSPQFLNKRN